MSTALRGYDAWKAHDPAQDGDWCAACGGRMRVTRDPDSWPFATHGDEATCCALCDAVWESRNLTAPDAVMRAIAEVMSLDGEAPLVRAKLNGGGREYVGTVVDWSVDGRHLTIERADGQEHDLRAGDVREVEVVDA